MCNWLLVSAHQYEYLAIISHPCWKNALCWFGAGLAGGPAWSCWRCWSTTMVSLMMLVAADAGQTDFFVTTLRVPTYT